MTPARGLPLLVSSVPLNARPNLPFDRLEWPFSLQIVDVELDRLSQHLAAMRARLLDILLAADLGEGVRVHGPRDQSLRLPNTLSIGIPGVEARLLLERVG